MRCDSYLEGHSQQYLGCLGWFSLANNRDVSDWLFLYLIATLSLPAPLHRGGLSAIVLILRSFRCVVGSVKSHASRRIVEQPSLDSRKNSVKVT